MKTKLIAFCIITLFVFGVPLRFSFHGGQFDLILYFCAVGVSVSVLLVLMIIVGAVISLVKK